MRKALIVGINYYSYLNPQLRGCVDDAYNVNSVLERHSDGTHNFDVKLLTGNGPSDAVNRLELFEQIRELFAYDNDIALFYFSGHGHIEITGGYILTSDSRTGNDAISLYDVINIANKSHTKNRIIILDSCHSGSAGAIPIHTSTSEIGEGLTILTASTDEQTALEVENAGVFSTLLVDALSGAAANLVGEITPGSVYAHIDQSLGSWEQRPVFKTNVKSFVSLRKVQPPISLSDLQEITKLFPVAGFEFKLDPSYEPERGNSDKDTPEPDPEKTAKFAILQKYNRVNLVVPIDAPHMWHAAMGNKACKLTVLGEHYRRLVEKGRI